MRDDAGDYAHHHRTRGFLNAVVTYCDALERLTEALHATDVQSQALLGLRDHLDGYLAGEAFRTLRDDARALDAEVDRVRYSFLLKGLRITVGP